MSTYINNVMWCPPHDGCPCQKCGAGWNTQHAERLEEAREQAAYWAGEVERLEAEPERVADALIELVRRA